MNLPRSTVLNMLRQAVGAPISLFALFLFAQAGWWFKSCYYAILTTGATTIVTYNPNTYHTNPSIMWSNYVGKWLKFSAGKFTLKLK